MSIWWQRFGINGSRICVRWVVLPFLFCFRSPLVAGVCAGCAGGYCCPLPPSALSGGRTVLKPVAGLEGQDKIGQEHVVSSNLSCRVPTRCDLPFRYPPLFPAWFAGHSSERVRMHFCRQMPWLSWFVVLSRGISMDEIQMDLSDGALSFFLACLCTWGGEVYREMSYYWRRSSTRDSWAELSHTPPRVSRVRGYVLVYGDACVFVVTRETAALFSFTVGPEHVELVDRKRTRGENGGGVSLRHACCPLS